MKLVFYLPLLIVLLIAYKVSAQESGERSNHSNSIEVVSIISDRQIYTLPITHPSFVGSEAIHHILDNPSSLRDALSTSRLFFGGWQQIITSLNAIIRDKQEIIESRQSSVQKIKEAVDSGNLDWIGVDRFSEELEIRPIHIETASYLENKNFLNTNLGPLDTWDTEKTEQLLFLMYDPYIIFFANNSHNPVSEIKVVSLIENHSLEEQADQYTSEKQIDQHNQDISNYTVAILENYRNLFTENQLLDFFNFMQNKQTRGSSTISDNKLKTLLDRLKVKKNAREHIKPLVETFNKAQSLRQKRRQNIIRSIRNQTGNGLIFLDPSDELVIKNGLKRACQNSLIK